MPSANPPRRSATYLLTIAATFGVGACGGDSPTDSGPDQDGPAQLLVAVIGEPTAGVPFDVTVTLADARGEPVEAESASTITLSLDAGVGTLRGTLMATLAAGASEATVPGVIYDHAEDGVRLAATGAGGTAAGLSTVSDPFRVVFDFSGELIAFRRTIDGDDDIYLMTPDGFAFVNLTDHPAVDSDPAWSPDGSRIAFVSNRAGPADLWVMNVDGTGLTRVTADQGSVRFPSWSPDGGMIAYSANVNDQRDLYVIDAPAADSPTSDGRAIAVVQEPSQVTDDPGTDNEPVWSPDGTEIFFYSNRDGQGAVWRIEFDGAVGSKPTRLTVDFVFACAPGIGWSVTESRMKLSFVAETGDQLDVWQMAIDGSNQVNVTNYPAADEFYSTWASKAPSSTASAGHPAGPLAPAGTATEHTGLVFDSNRDGRWQLYSSLDDGSGVVRLTEHPADDRMPRWRP